MLSELDEALALLQKQYPLVQGYFVDQVRDKMIGGEAAIGVIYSGEAIYTQRENEDLVYVVPKEGSNVWIDGWVVPKTAQNKENAFGAGRAPRQVPPRLWCSGCSRGK